MSQAQPTFTTTDPKYAALALTLGSRLLPPRSGRDGLLLFEFAGAPADLVEQVANDGISVKARDFIANLEAMHRLLQRHKRARGW